MWGLSRYSGWRTKLKWWFDPMVWKISVLQVVSIGWRCEDFKYFLFFLIKTKLFRPIRKINFDLRKICEAFSCAFSLCDLASTCICVRLWFFAIICSLCSSLVTCHQWLKRGRSTLVLLDYAWPSCSFHYYFLVCCFFVQSGPVLQLASQPRLLVLLSSSSSISVSTFDDISTSASTLDLTLNVTISKLLDLRHISAMHFYRFFWAFDSPPIFSCKSSFSASLSVNAAIDLISAGC